MGKVIKSQKTSSRMQKMIEVGRKAYERFLKIRGTPREIALGFGLGLFIGMSPTMGAQMPIAIFFAALFKWNKVAAAAGVWITNPITAPVLYGITYLIGARLIGLSNIIHFSGELNFDFFYHLILKSPDILLALTIGGLVTGIPLAVIGYYFTFSAVSRYQGDIKQKLAKQKEFLRQRKLQRKAKRSGKKNRVR